MATSSSSNKNVKALSAKLLAGWTMLQDTCTSNPDCLVPLMENRKGDGKIICVGCDAEYSRDKDGHIELKHAAPAPPADEKKDNASAPVATSTPAVPTITAKPSPAPSAAPPVSAPPVAISSASAPAVPDTEKVKSANELSAAPKLSAGEDSDDEWTPPTAEELAAMEERRKRTDKTSALLGEKLLKGWTMLADCCMKPECCVPLMRDPATGQRLCVSCNSVVSETKDEPQQTTEKEKTFTAPPPSPSKPAAAKSTAVSSTTSTAPTLLSLGPTVSVTPADKNQNTKRVGEGSHATATAPSTASHSVKGSRGAKDSSATAPATSKDSKKEKVEKDAPKDAKGSANDKKEKPKKRRMQSDDSDDSDTPVDLPRLEVRFDQHQRQQQQQQQPASSLAGDGPTRPRDEEQVLSRAVVSILSQIETATRQLSKSDTASASQAIMFLKSAFVTLGTIKPLFNSMRPSEAGVRKWINENMGAILDKAGRVLLRRLDRLSEELSDTHDWEKAKLVIGYTNLVTSTMASLRELNNMP